MTTLRGGCHCGNLEVTLETQRRAEDLPVRACGCSFCRKHGARSTSDPEGRARVTIHDPAGAIRYRFGLHIADYIVCARCGIYVGAVMAEPDGAWALLNVNTLADAERFASAGEPMDYEGEAVDQRRARRRARWTPAVA